MQLMLNASHISISPNRVGVCLPLLQGHAKFNYVVYRKRCDYIPFTLERFSCSVGNNKKMPMLRLVPNEKLAWFPTMSWLQTESNYFPLAMYTWRF